MQIRVPVSYTVKGCPKGTRNPRACDHWELVTIEILDVDDTTAPLAITWDDRIPDSVTSFRDTDHWQQRNKVPENGIQSMRWLDGKFYIKSASYPEIDDFLNQIKPGNQGGLLGLKFLRANRLDKEEPFRPEDYRAGTDLESNYDERLKEIKDAAEKVLFAPDGVYQLSSEPVIHLETLRDDRNTIVLAPRILPLSKAPANANLHSVLEYEEFVEERNATNHSRFGREIPDIVLDKQPIIHRPEFFRFNPAVDNLVAACRFTIDREGEYTRLVHVDVDYGIAYLQMKKEFLKSDGNIDVDELLRCAEMMIESKGIYVVDSLKEAVKAFQDAPITIRPAHGNKPA